MKEETKTLAHFQQQVAENYGYKDWPQLIEREFPYAQRQYLEEAAEAYATYQFEQGENTGYTRGYSNGLERAKLIDDSMLEAERKTAKSKGWNEAIHWAANTIGSNSYLYTREAHSQSILNGLKEEE